MRIPPRQDRRGFYEFIALSLIIIALSLLGYLRCSSEGQYHRIVCIASAIVGVAGLITAEGLSRPPHNGPHEFVRDESSSRWGKRDDNDVKVLVCLGDSLTHGACSANWVDSVTNHYLKAQPKQPKLLVVNAGQNSICTHTILKERVDHVIDCKPDFIFVMIGTNDVMAMYRQDWAKDKIRLWNLPEIPTEEITIRNLTDIVRRLLDDTNAKVALATLPPMGEDIHCAANQLVQKINRCIIHDIQRDFRTEKRFSVVDINGTLWTKINRNSPRNRKYFHSVDNFLQYAVLFGFFHCVFGVRWEVLSGVFTGNVVLLESLHLNEVGGAVVRDKVVEWLIMG